MARRMVDIRCECHGSSAGACWRTDRTAEGGSGVVEERCRAAAQRVRKSVYGWGRGKPGVRVRMRVTGHWSGSGG